MAASPLPDPLEALAAQRGSRKVEFVAAFSPEAPGAWCELIKDIVAIANSGGGVIVVGVDKAGNPTGRKPAALLEMDRADVVSSIATYVGERFDELAISGATKAGQTV